MTGAPLIELSVLGDSPESTADSHLIQLTDILNPLPENLLAKWPRAARYYGRDGERLDTEPWDFDHCTSGSSSDSEDDDFLDEYEEEASGPAKPRDPLEKLFKDNKPAGIDDDEKREIVSLLISLTVRSG
ncbi:hypothetical protein BJ170DRAFT_89409 [Xylariales sp. AK1849]|nr:hypothetical protein BJ170DRAFT_89409 [Xylariales sp. AK1849]